MLNRHFVRLSILLSFALLHLISLSAYATSWQQHPGKLTLLDDNDAVIWQFNYKRKFDKPFFHPIYLADGTLITRHQPDSDEHPWHKGLWFSFKLINGTNFWEENKSTGMSEGSTQLTSTKLTLNTDGSAIIKQSLSYQINGRSVIIENRLIQVSAPKQETPINISWQAEFNALADVHLSRTPIIGEKDGRGYGGYAGLSWRFAPQLKKHWQFSYQQNTLAKQIHGKDFLWLYYGGDNGGVQISKNQTSVTKQTEAWYISKNMPFMSPAFLFAGDQHFKQGQSWLLSYKIKIFRQPSTAAQHLTNDQ
ncbi:DUF6807 family protein [Catenovulum adriaticum]|uniref:PmoA family protein n=1 Tax=Catenovulum adriaticum TaxID=2984846 RepID=A0ABY7AUI6_9ALTE|nr:DUF6807 family protein [Catenovulum sp. TS8]WAJ71936.1 PmoA family protein [Catenovulum sp. TS8]